MNTKFTPSRALIHLVLMIALGFFMLPAYFALVNSFKPLEEIYAGNVFGLPQRWTVEPWIKAWGSACTGAAECGDCRVTLSTHLSLSSQRPLSALSGGASTVTW